MCHIVVYDPGWGRDRGGASVVRTRSAACRQRRCVESVGMRFEGVGGDPSR
jgi:hypothetical protein